MGIWQDRHAFIIAKEYGFMPYDNSKYEAELLQDDNWWAVHANRANASNLLVKYVGDELIEPD